MKAIRLADGAPLRLAIALALLATVALGGGSARFEVWSLLYVRPIVMAGVVALFVLTPRDAIFTIRWPLTLFALFLAWTALQLVPLPPALWESLPGHLALAEAQAKAGMTPVWRPISLTPDLTLNALVAASPAIAGMLALMAVPDQVKRYLLYAVFLVAFVSAVLGIVQIGVPGFELYGVSHRRLAAGILANRNHQAAFLALSIAILPVWLARRDAGPSRMWMAGAMALLIILVALATGSRAGAVLTLLAGALSLAIMRATAAGTPPYRARATRIIAVVVPTIVVAAATWWGAATSFDRLAASVIGNEQRVALAPTTARLAWSYFPFGAGAGAFDAAFRMVEPDWALHPTYFNHAHNDFLELIITGGLPALLLLGAFLWWWGTAVGRLLRLPLNDWRETGWFGAVGVGILMLASLVDYPLRTPLLSFVLGICIASLAIATRRATGGSALPG